MNNPLDNPGVLATVMERFEKHRLPRILDIKEMVERGESLKEFEIEFLRKVFEDAQRYQPFVQTHPEFQQLFATVTHLYHSITSAALANETQASGKKP